MVEDLVIILEDKRKAESGQQSGDMDQMNASNMMKGAEKYMPKMSNFKFPSMPKF